MIKEGDSLFWLEYSNGHSLYVPIPSLPRDRLARAARTATPDGLDVVLTIRHAGEFLRSLQMKTSIILISGSSMPP
jgi:hypothetical protein